MISQNGWPASQNPDAVNIKRYSVTLRGKTFNVRFAEAAAPALIEMAKWWDANIEPVTELGGYNYREIRGKEGTGRLSNHSSGTAVDINWTLHPLGAVGTVRADRVQALRGKAASLGLRWGGDYRNRKDEHHIEVKDSPVVFAAGRLSTSDDISVVKTAEAVSQIVDTGSIVTGAALVGGAGAVTSVLTAVALRRRGKTRVMLPAAAAGLSACGVAALGFWIYRRTADTP
jgi:hypothetical protein